MKNYLELNPDPPECDKPETDDDKEVFFKDNFEQFHFPYQNKGSFTVAIENQLANTWHESISSLLGEPQVKINSWGTECDMFWKLNHAGIEITLHIYINPKNRKGSKLMLQGSSQSLLCQHVFEELPKMYKLVCANRPKKVKMNKLGTKPEKPAVKCDQCKYKSTMMQMKMHMKTVHAARPVRASKRLHNFTPLAKTAKKTKSEDALMNCEGMVDESLLLMEDSFSGKGSPVEMTMQEDMNPKTLEEECIGDIPQTVLHNENVFMDTDDSTCNKCDYVGKDPGSLKNHIEESHENRISDEDIEKLGGQILTEFFCTLCVFVTDNNSDLENHLQIKHKSDETHTTREDLTNPHVPLDDELEVASESDVQSPRYNCGKCEYSSNDKELLNRHIDESHKTHHIVEGSSESEDALENTETEMDLLTCKKCSLKMDNQDILRKHMSEKHLVMNVYNCTSCDYRTTVFEDFKVHVDTRHLSVEVKVDQARMPDLMKPKIIFQCTQCEYNCGLRIQLQKHCASKHVVQQCDDCTYNTNDLEKMAEHKASKHAMIDFFCDICEFTTRTPFVMHKHKVEVHNHKDNEESRYNTMQQLFLTGLAAQVDNLMVAVIVSKDEVLEQIADLKTNNATLETELSKTKVELSEVKEAFKKSNAFCINMQHDSEAMLRNVADKCSKLEEVTKKIMKKNIDVIEPEIEVEVPMVGKVAAKKPNVGRSKKKHKLAWVGTSISKQLDKNKLEEDLKVDLKVERAYCIEDEANARFRDMNFRAIVPRVIAKDDVDTLVLQTGSIEISNIDVNKAVMDTKKPIDEYKKDWFEQVERDSSNLFNVAEDALKKSKDLQKVVIIKRLPRYDRSRDDILGIKAQLSEYANAYYDQTSSGRREAAQIISS